MDVTRKNFKEELESVSDSIKQAAFLAIDSEFTGLSLPSSSLHMFETPAERYGKLKESVSQFLLIQFGLAAFEYLADSDRYRVRVFNFYVFPRPFARQAPDPRFVCQSSSIEFLASQGFDFNKLFTAGIPYLRQTDEDNLKASLRDKHVALDARNQSHKIGGAFSSPAFSSPLGEGLTTAVNKGPCDVPDEHKAFIEDICTRIQKFLESSSDTELALEPSNGFLRKLTFQSVGQRFPSGIHLESKTNEKRFRYILVTKVGSEEEMKRREAEKRAAEFAEIDDAVGFSKVIRMICQAEKPVVGHNMFMDLLYILNQFCAPLPSDYEDFKHLTRTLLPNLVDTKYMCSSSPFREKIRNTSLGELYQTLREEPFSVPEVEIPDGFTDYSKNATERYHEAGYDAYITGLNFIGLCNHLGSDPPTMETDEDSGEEITRQTVLPSSELVQPYVNKLFLMKMPDVPCINLSGSDVTPDRGHVFHISFPKEWKSTDLVQLFAAFGNIQISWIDDTSAYIALYQRVHADMVLKHIPSSEFYKISAYQDHVRHKCEAMYGTPKQFTGEKRKPSPVSDLELPRKKRRSSRESPYTSNRSIPTIPEEEEAPIALNLTATEMDSSTGCQGDSTTPTAQSNTATSTPQTDSSAPQTDSSTPIGDTTLADIGTKVTPETENGNTQKNGSTQDTNNEDPAVSDSPKKTAKKRPASEMFEVPESW